MGNDGALQRDRESTAGDTQTAVIMHILVFMNSFKLHAGRDMLS